MYKEVTNCRGCGGNMTEVFDMGSQYVVDFPKEQDPSLLKAPLTLMKCNVCDLVQLKHSVEPDRLYKKFWYRSGINQQMKDELLLIVTKAKKSITLQKGDCVLDIGCNDGTLLGWYDPEVRTYGVDPCKELVEEGFNAHRIDVAIPDYFYASLFSTKFKIITAIAMFYDLDNPVQFLKDCKSVLHDEGVLIVQMNYLYGMLVNTAFDNICHEHLAYYSVSTLKRVIEAAGLELQGVELTPCNGGSFRVYITHKGFDAFHASDHSQKVWLWTNALVRIEAEMKLGLDTVEPYKVFAKAIERKIAMLREYLDSVSSMYGTSKIYAYGASTRGTVLLQYLYGIGANVRIAGVAERDENKYGRKMVGTWLPIVSEEVARKKATYMLVLPWHFKESIVERERKWMEGGGTLIFPLPSPSVQTASGSTKLSAMQAVRQ